MRTRIGKAGVRVGREVVEVTETCFFMLAWGLVTIIRRRRRDGGR